MRAKLNLEPSSYSGPTGIVGVFQDACAQVGISAASFWAAVPYYVAQPPCPKATLALLRKIEDVLDVPVPLGDLPEEARAWQDGVDELAAEDQEVADYVRSLEEAKDTTELPEASGEAIAKEFERYLRRRDEGPARRTRLTPRQLWIEQPLGVTRLVVATSAGRRRRRRCAGSHPWPGCTRRPR